MIIMIMMGLVMMIMMLRMIRIIMMIFMNMVIMMIVMIRMAMMIKIMLQVGAIREQYSINLFPYPPTLSLVNSSSSLWSSSQSTPSS